MTNQTNLLKTAQALFMLNTLIWVVVGLNSLPKMTSLTMTIVVLLMFGNAVTMLVCAIGLGLRKKIFHYLALTVIGVNIILSIADQFGWVDLLVLLLNIGLFAMLLRIKPRSSFSKN